MNKRPLLLLVFALFAGVLQVTAQEKQPSLDSAAVMDRIKELSKPNVLKDSVFVQAELLLGMSSVQQNNVLKAETLYLIGRTQIANAQYAQSRERLSQAMEVLHTGAITDTMLYTRVLIGLGMSEGKLGNVALELQHLQEAIDWRSRAYGPEHTSLSTVYVNMGAALLRAERYPEAIDIYRKVIVVRERELGPNHEKLIAPYQNLSIALKKMGNYEDTKACFQKIEGILRHNAKPDDLRYAYLYEGMANMYDDRGDFALSIACHQKALFIRMDKLGEDHDDTANSYFNIGNVLRKSGKYQEALSSYEKGCAIYRRILGDAHVYTADCNGTMASCYIPLGRMKEAEAAYRNALDTILLHNGETGEYAGDALSSMGYFYTMSGQFDLAAHYLNRSLIVFKALQGDHGRWVAELYYQLGQLHHRQRHYAQADSFFRQSLEATYFDADKPDFSACSNVDLVFEPLVSLAIVTARQERYQQAMQYFQLSQQLNDVVRMERTDDWDRSLLLRNELLVTEGIMAVSFVQGKLHPEADPNFLFVSSGRCKSLALLSSVKNAEALHFGGVPDDMVSKERTLKSEVSYYQSKITEFRMSGGAITAALALGLSEKYLQAKLRYDGFIDQLEQSCPRYHQLKYKTNPLSLAELQAEISPLQTLIEYFVCDTAVYLFAVRLDTFAAVEIKQNASFELNALVRQLRSSLTNDKGYKDPSNTHYNTNAADYAQAAFALYQKLIAPISSVLTSKVIIVPDGILGYIPFDALLTENPAAPNRYHNHHYLGEAKQISYAYSAALLREMRQKKHATKPTQTLLALAPFYRGNPNDLLEWADTTASGTSKGGDQLTSLRFSGQEIKDVANIFKGKPYFGVQADKTAYQKEVDKYRIIHLSTHGKANDLVGEYAWLAFATPGDTLSFEKLYVKDIYNLTLNADMIALSACETGIGEWRRGEGIISLARAYAYAGAKSIVTTLWPVNDERTAELMRLFYQNLKNGTDKDVALWKAKKDFIQLHKKDNGAHPFFWSGFIPIGDMSKL